MSITIEEAKARLAEKFGDSTRLGGKGVPRRKKKVAPKSETQSDSKLSQIIRKSGCQPIPGIDEVNLFKDDNSIIHFKNPEVLASVQNNTFFFSGKPETKSIQEMFPDILQQLGPKQFSVLQDMLKTMKQTEGIKEEDEDDVPDLVNKNFEEESKKID